MPICSFCQVGKTRTAYSSAQLRKGSDSRRCRVCIAEYESATETIIRRLSTITRGTYFNRPGILLRREPNTLYIYASEKTDSVTIFMWLETGQQFVTTISGYITSEENRDQIYRWVDKILSDGQPFDPECVVCMEPFERGDITCGGCDAVICMVCAVDLFSRSSVIEFDCPVCRDRSFRGDSELVVDSDPRGLRMLQEFMQANKIDRCNRVMYDRLNGLCTVGDALRCSAFTRHHGNQILTVATKAKTNGTVRFWTTSGLVGGDLYEPLDFVTFRVTPDGGFDLVGLEDPPECFQSIVAHLSISGDPSKSRP
jgi:hypothetical protein